MDYIVFNALLDKIVAEEKKIGESKAKEYTQGDRLDNFKRLANELNLTPAQIWAVYFKKHVDSIMSYCRTGNVLSEDIRGRILDARVYLSLLWGLVEEKEQVKSDAEINS
jgi:hypothetical protein